MLEERLVLKGNKTERIYQALRKAGWFPGRKTDISAVLEYYEKWNIELNLQAISFFKEYSKEYIVMVGEIGYYYPARVWIGNSGTIYLLMIMKMMC
ncbi:MAG: hypothetical protein HDR30_01425 [Lachnospiraceae bacterium]|nr:hypothetical protein [Lachnospiraceae bacterium]